MGLKVEASVELVLLGAVERLRRAAVDRIDAADRSAAADLVAAIARPRSGISAAERCAELDIVRVVSLQRRRRSCASQDRPAIDAPARRSLEDDAVLLAEHPEVLVGDDELS